MMRKPFFICYLITDYSYKNNTRPIQKGILALITYVGTCEVMLGEVKILNKVQTDI